MLTLQQKKIFLSDVLYVLRQAQAYRDFGKPVSATSTDEEKAIHNALLESSLSFLRKINEFFGGKREASVRTLLPDHPLDWLWDQSDCDILNNQVMHLSLFHANSGSDYDWSNFLTTHLPEAVRRFNLFLARLQNEQPELFKE